MNALITESKPVKSNKMNVNFVNNVIQLKIFCKDLANDMVFPTMNI